MVVNALVDSFLPQSEKKCENERVQIGLTASFQEPQEWAPDKLKIVG